MCKIRVILWCDSAERAAMYHADSRHGSGFDEMANDSLEIQIVGLITRFYKVQDSILVECKTQDVQKSARL